MQHQFKGLRPVPPTLCGVLLLVYIPTIHPHHDLMGWGCPTSAWVHYVLLMSCVILLGVVVCLWDLMEPGFLWLVAYRSGGVQQTSLYKKKEKFTSIVNAIFISFDFKRMQQL